MRRFALGPELGQCCGGQVDLLVEVFAADRARRGRRASRRARPPGAFATARHDLRRTGVERGPSPTMPFRRARRPARAACSREGFGDDRRPLILFGAGHVGRALVLALAPLPFAVTWVDPRPDAFPAYVPANVTLRRLDDPAEALSPAPAGSFVLVMTHSHPLDLALVHAALARRALPLCRPDRLGHQARPLREAAGREAGVPAARIADAGLSDRRRRHRLEGAGGDRRGDRRRAARPRRGAARWRDAGDGGLHVRRAAG